MVGMQTIERYAEKSGVVLKKEGSCQFCGSEVAGGVYECFEVFQQYVGETANPNDIRSGVQLIIVDAHALQHSEVHGVRNNNYHLLRLLGIYRYGTSARIGANNAFLSPILDPKADVPHLDSPQIGNRGRATITDVVSVQNINDSVDVIRSWGKDVLDAWEKYESWANEEWARLRV